MKELDMTGIWYCYGGQYFCVNITVKSLNESTVRVVDHFCVNSTVKSRNERIRDDKYRVMLWWSIISV